MSIHLIVTVVIDGFARIGVMPWWNWVVAVLKISARKIVIRLMDVFMIESWWIETGVNSVWTKRQWSVFS